MTDTHMVTTGGSEVEEALISQIRKNHDLANAAAQEAIEYAIKVGTDLLRLKEIVPRGQWADYIYKHFPFKVRTAQNYMRLARDPEKTQRVAHLGVKGALAELAQPKSQPVIHEGAEHLIDEIKDKFLSIDEAEAEAERNYRMAALEIQAALQEGSTWSEVAKHVERDEDWVRDLVSRFGEQSDLLGRLQDLLPDIEGDAWVSFKHSIADDGVKVPICVDEDGRIIDGRQRHRACEELGIDVPTITYPGLNVHEKAKMCFSLNVVRKSPTDAESAQVESRIVEAAR